MVQQGEAGRHLRRPRLRGRDAGAGRLRGQVRRRRVLRGAKHPRSWNRGAVCRRAVPFLGRRDPGRRRQARRRPAEELGRVRGPRTNRKPRSGTGLSFRYRGREITMTLRALGAIVLALLVFVPASSATTPSAAPPARLNIVFVLTDAQSVESAAKMPFVRAYRSWVRFDNAFINDPVCCPSRATLLTGLNSHHTRIENNSDRSRFDDSSTLATWLQRAGYRTGLFGKYHLGTHGEPPTYVPPGWSDWASFPDGAYYNYTLNENGTLVKYGSKPQDYSTDVLAGKALDFLQRADGTKPFCRYLSTRAPHDSYAAAPRYVGRFKDATIVHTANFNEPDMSDKPAWWQTLTARQARDIDNARRKEYASLLAVDDAVKQIFETLKQKGLLSRTVVVFMTDNGVAL